MDGVQGLTFIVCTLEVLGIFLWIGYLDQISPGVFNIIILHININNINYERFWHGGLYEA